MNINDPIGDRMKAQYEDRTRYRLPRRTYTIIRIDGKAFHTYTHGRNKPFDTRLNDSMDMAALVLCKSGCGVRLAYGQSDEYSFLLTDFETNQSQAWFDGNIQKICSVSASIFTEAFNKADDGGTAHFDARVFTIPDPTEVENYFIWRQQDATRNSIQSVAQTYFSPKELHGVSTTELQDKLMLECEINWNDLPTQFKRGRCCKKVDEVENDAIVVRTSWQVDNDIPVFTQDRAYLSVLIPRIS